ncbi:hypothetical protein CCY99_02095 [Helicobacter sp. 16-1353]|uniref:hypothetical protein n=1 Tax=Helicobacter sp. 16-1353 TaxID=2004996 RepID=UPI000DCD83CE|nr:hypothetical protein [Helicobacter sp. 16-1353]RAX54956.1 hypothetical protein CCY99_02095 [Helicobacter sp. 16-1353]
MRILEFLNDIDWSKNIILFIVYIMVVVFCILFYLMPIIQNHRMQTLDYKKIQNLDYTINNNVEILNHNLQTMLEKDKQVYKNIRNKIDVEDLQQYISKFLNNVKIVDEGTESNNDNIEINKIYISGEAKNTQEIISLIENLKLVNNSVRINFPINITKQNNILKVEFGIKIYHSSYQF